MWLNRRWGIGISWMGVVAWDVTFALLHCWQSRHHPATSDAMPRHTTLEDMRRLVALIPGWAKECNAEKTAWRSCMGITGLAGPWEKSQRTQTPCSCTGRTTKEEDDRVLWVSLHEA